MTAPDRDAGRPLRIGLVTPGFSASESDWCIPAQLDLVRALAERDDVRVFALRYPHEERRYEVYGAEVFSFAAAQRRGGDQLGLWWRVLAALRREHRRRPFDVLHALWAHEPGLLAGLAGRLLRVPVVVSVLGGELVDLPDIGYGGRRTWLNSRLIAFALRLAARVTVGSQFLRRVAEEARLWDERWTVWPLGVDTTRFHPAPREEAAARAAAAGAPVLDGDPALLHVGSLVPVKDQAALLRAFADVRPQQPQARLHVVGDGPQRDALEALAQELGLADVVRFHGGVGHELLADVYRQADLFVLGSRFESQCMAVVEAAACGCPAAGTAVGALPELFPETAVGAPSLAATLAQPRPARTSIRRAPIEKAYTLPVSCARLRGLYAEASRSAPAVERAPRERVAEQTARGSNPRVSSLCLLCLTACLAALAASSVVTGGQGAGRLVALPLALAILCTWLWGIKSALASRLTTHLVLYLALAVLLATAVVGSDTPDTRLGLALLAWMSIASLVGLLGLRRRSRG